MPPLLCRLLLERIEIFFKCVQRLDSGIDSHFMASRRFISSALATGVFSISGFKYPLSATSFFSSGLSCIQLHQQSASVCFYYYLLFYLGQVWDTFNLHGTLGTLSQYHAAASSAFVPIYYRTMDWLRKGYFGCFQTGRGL